VWASQTKTQVRHSLTRCPAYRATLLLIRWAQVKTALTFLIYLTQLLSMPNSKIKIFTGKKVGQSGRKVGQGSLNRDQRTQLPLQINRVHMSVRGLSFRAWGLILSRATEFSLPLVLYWLGKESTSLKWTPGNYISGWGTHNDRLGRGS